MSYCKVCEIQICSHPEEVCWSCLYSKFGQGDISEPPSSDASNFPRKSLERKYSAKSTTKSRKTTSETANHVPLAHWEQLGTDNKDSTSQFVPRRPVSCVESFNHHTLSKENKKSDEDLVLGWRPQIDNVPTFEPRVGKNDQQFGMINPHLPVSDLSLEPTNNGEVKNKRLDHSVGD